jgi:hypothetical protein
VAPHTKLATTRWWHSSTLADEFAVADADADDLYAAMDWLLERQQAIEKKLAARHLRAGGLVLYDLTLPRFHVHQIVGNFLMNGGRNGKEGVGSESAVHRGVQD